MVLSQDVLGHKNRCIGPNLGPTRRAARHDAKTPRTASAGASKTVTIMGPVHEAPRSVTQIGGVGNTATGGNCGSPERKVTWELADRAVPHAANEAAVSITTDRSLEIPAFMARCDRPCKTSDQTGADGLSQFTDLHDRNDPAHIGILFVVPRPLGAGIRVIWRIHGVDTDVAPKILAVTALSREDALKIPRLP
jgi:hypothetical protein